VDCQERIKAFPLDGFSSESADTASKTLYLIAVSTLPRIVYMGNLRRPDRLLV